MRLVQLLLLTLWFLPLSGCLEKTPPAHNARILAFGTLIDVTLVGKREKDAEAAVERLNAYFQEMHNNWHAWEPGPLQQTNEGLKSCEPFEPHPMVRPLIELSVPLAVASEHLFNPAIGHLIRLWGFQGNQPACDQLPSEDAILALVQQAPRMSDLKQENGLLRSTNPAVKLDFGAIGKGYGVDQAIKMLRGLGIEDAIVNAGGNLRAIGSRGGRPWRVGVKHPDGSVLGTLEISGDESVSTSGNYERRYQCGGKVYHHIIDPRTGYPTQGTDSVTVLHGDATTADAASTALFVAGPKDWQRIAHRMGISYVALLDDQGRLHLTPAMAKRLQLLNKSIQIVVSERAGH